MFLCLCLFFSPEDVPPRAYHHLADDADVCVLRLIPCCCCLQAEVRQTESKAEYDSETAASKQRMLDILKEKHKRVLALQLQGITRLSF